MNSPKSRFQRARELYFSAALVAFNTVVLIVTIELFLGVVRWGKNTLLDALTPPQPLISDEKIKILQLAQPNKSAEEIRQLRSESNHLLEYAPWVQFKMPEKKSRFVNISGFIRQSRPSLSNSAHVENRDTFDIFFFGGSTMFGYHVADDETIPSHFARLIGRLAGDKIPVGYGISASPIITARRNSSCWSL